jgi:transposase
MTDILDLEGWQVLEKRHDGGEYQITIEYTKHPDTCQKCGVVGMVYRHGPKVVTYRDSPIRGRPVKLLAKLQRYRCRDCGGTFLQPLEGMEEDRRMTTRCVRYVEEQCLRDSFTRLAEHVGCVEGTVRNIAQTYIARLSDEYRPHQTTWLGIDEVMLSKQLRCMITDVGNRIPVDMLADRSKTTVIAWLRAYPYRSSIQGVATDMWRPYKDAVAEVLPGIPVVVDKFHVVAMVSRGLEAVRRGMRADISAKMRRHLMRSRFLMLKRPKDLGDKDRLALQMMLDNAPDLKAAYELKEEFAGIYDLPKAQAVLAYRAWPAKVPKHLRPAFKEILTAMGNWETEILAYFDYPITNGYTEAVNGVAKVISRAGRGYTFDVLRAKVLFKNPRKPPAPWRLKTAYPTNDMATQILLRENGNRCESCRGVFEEGKLVPSHVAAIVKGEHTKKCLICEACFKRFHTESSKTHKSDSTR